MLLDRRADFPILDQRVHGDRRLAFLDNAASTHVPHLVHERMREAAETSYANVHRGIHVLSERATQLYEEARAKVARFLNATSPREIVFTSGTTASINLVARTWGEANIGPGDEIVLTVLEHHSNLVPWHQLAARTGCVLKFVPLEDDGTVSLDGFRAAITSKTRLVAVSGMSNVLGTIPPVAEIARLAHAAGALILVDGAQSVAHAAHDVRALDIDFLAFSGHKMCGPTGIGVLWAREALLTAMPPFLGGGGMIQNVTLEGFASADLPDKFEAGTPPILPAIGLGYAIDYLTSIGMDAIHKHEHTLLEAAFARLSELEGVRILGPSVDNRGSLVSFVVGAAHAHDVAQMLDSSGVAVRAGHHCTMPLHKQLGIAASTRASFALYNTMDDVDALVEGLGRVQRIFGRPRRRRGEALSTPLPPGEDVTQ